jgi:hypothetical protein
MKRITLLVAVIAVTGTTAFSQRTYQKAIGIRISESYYDIASVSYKFFVSDPGALELNGGFGARNYSYVGSKYGAFALTAALNYQHHFDIGSVNGLRWYIGGGAMVYNVFSDHDNYKGFAFGLYPTGGIDYKFPNIPLDVSADYRPTIFLARPDYYSAFYGTNFGVAARYVINDR